MVDYKNAIKRPFTDWKSFLIGGAISAIPLVNMISIGYALECAIDTKHKLPKWDALPYLWLRGFLTTLGSMIYMLPGLIGILIAVIVAITAATADRANIGLSVWQIVLIILSTIYILVVQYILPAAQVHYAIDGKFKYFFEFKEIFRHAFTTTYLKAWLASVAWAVLLGIIGFIGAVLLFITIVGPFFVQGLVQFTVLVTSLTLIGQTYQEVY